VPARASEAGRRRGAGGGDSVIRRCGQDRARGGGDRPKRVVGLLRQDVDVREGAPEPELPVAVIARAPEGPGRLRPVVPHEA